MKYLSILLFSLAMFIACENKSENQRIEAASDVEYTPEADDMTGNFKDDTTGVNFEKDTLPVIVKEAEKKED